MAPATASRAYYSDDRAEVGSSRVEHRPVGDHHVIPVRLSRLEPDETGEMILTALHPGKTVEQARENTGWSLKIADKWKTTQQVTEAELRILREQLDPTGIYLKSGG